MLLQRQPRCGHLPKHSRAHACRVSTPAWHMPRRAAAAAQAAPALETVTADYVVVGTGVVGLCIAHRLLQQGASVVVTDREKPCAGATGAGQGYIWMSHRDPSSPLWQLAAAGKARWAQLAAEDTPLSRAMEWQVTGSLLLATTAADRESLQARQQRLQAAGLTDAQLLTSAEVKQLEPALRLPEDAAGLLVPSDAQLNGRATAEALLELCRQQGADVRLHQTTTGIHAGAAAGVTVEVTTTEARMHARKGVVVAAGVWSGELLVTATGDPCWRQLFAPRRGHLVVVQRSGDPLVSRGIMELAYTKYYSSATTAAPGAQSTPDLDIIFTATSSKDGDVLVGSSREFCGWSVTREDDVVKAILERAVDFLPTLKGNDPKQQQARVGLRPYAIGGMPVIGQVPGLPGVAVAAGHEGSGLCLGPGTADLIASLLCSDGQIMDAFSPTQKLACMTTP